MNRSHFSTLSLLCVGILMPLSGHAQRQLERPSVPRAAQSGTAPAPAPTQGSTTVTGRITSIVVDDPARQPNSTRDERRFIVRITLDTVEGTVLGFAPVNNNGAVEMQQALLDTALLAFEKDFPVALQLERPLSNQTNPRAQNVQTRSHVRIVGIMIRRP